MPRIPPRSAGKGASSRDGAGARGVGLPQSGIGTQVVLPFSKAVEISLKSLRIRFWRSLVTVGGIVLAIAFLTFTLTGGILGEACAVQEGGEGGPSSRPADAASGPAGAGRETGAPGAAAGEPSSGGNTRSAGAASAEGDGSALKEYVTRYWLVILSLLVAVIGIANSMLMAVTERFREIGTMKCLGALNSFIVKLFLLESSFMGVAGTVIGIALGFVLALAAAAVAHGAGTVIAAFPAAAVARRLAFAMATGVVLSVFGAIYPALVAARMEPVAALRQEF